MLRFPETTLISRPAEDLALGERLAIMQGRRIGPTEVFRHLNAAQLKGVLVGAHAVNARAGDPRATLDVDIVAEKPKKVVELLHRAFPELDVHDHPVVTRFKDNGREAIDVIKPISSRLFKRVLKMAEILSVDGVPIPVGEIEALIALKFQAMTNPSRAEEKKFKDASDFIGMSKQLKRVDETKLNELGDLAFEGGGAELLKLVKNARDGKRIEF